MQALRTRRSLLLENKMAPRHSISLKRDKDKFDAVTTLGELAIAAIYQSPSIVDVRIERESLLLVEVSFIWIYSGVPRVSDEKLRHFGLSMVD